MAPLSRGLGPTVLIGALVAFAPACRNDEAGSAGVAPGAPAAPGPEPVPAGSSALPASTEFSDPAFHLAIRPAGEYVAGTPGAAEIVLTPKGEYHCNDRYPYKLRVSSSPSIRYSAPVVGVDAAALTPARATLRLAFTPEKAGPATVGGLFSFSVCSDDRCLIEKRQLALPIVAK